MATMKDVALKAGVTLTTVSRVLNNRGYIGKETREKVMKAMKALNYTPDPIARAMVQKHTQVFGIIVPALMHPYFSSCVNYCEKYASILGYKIMVCNSQHDNNKEKEYIEMLKAHRVAGIIICTNNPNLDKTIGEFPVISIERSISSIIPSVLCDNYQGGKLATRELIENGCKNLVIISGNHPTEIPSSVRIQGFIDEATDCGVAYSVHNTAEQQFFSRNYSDLIRDIMGRNPEVDGIFATSDVIGAQVIQVCHEMKKNIPSDVKIVGFDDVEISKLTYPELTTIQQPIEAMCEFAIDILYKRVKDEPVPIQTIMPVKLIKRATTKE